MPLHGGRVPHWLSARMARLGRVIVEAIVLEYGRDELLRRLAHPFWFQSFGAVMGMDWHSSGITTSVIGALKRGLEPVADELGLHVCGGRGKHSRKTPGELRALGERRGLPADELIRASRLVAKVDSAAVQDGHAIYLHGFIVSAEGRWVVVQQGMNTALRQARRYHWLSEGLRSFVEEPHAAIDALAPTSDRAAIINLTDRRARSARGAQLELVAGGPDRVLAEARKLREVQSPAPTEPLPLLQLPDHHELRADDVVLRRLHATLSAAAERGPEDFAELLLTPGVGARTVETLAAVAEVVHGAPCRFSDPGRFSLALGGKDGHPFPVPLRVYDETLGVLRRAVDGAKLGNDDRLASLRRLDQAARAVDAAASGGPSFADFVARERRRAPDYGGMTVFGPATGRRAGSRAKPRKDRSSRPRSDQLELPGVDE